MKRNAFRRLAGATAVATVTAVVLAGCGSGSDGHVAAAPPSKLQGTVTLWDFFDGREAGDIQKAADLFQQQNPGVHVDLHQGQDDDKLQQAISAGQPIDVGLSYSTQIVGSFCASGAFRDLTPYIQRDGVDLNGLAQTPRQYTAFDGKQCALPVLADTVALMYNKDAFAKAGITSPPKTLDDLEADALKMTTYNPDGSIKTLGFDPLMGFYENIPEHFSPMVDGQWFGSDGKPAIGTSPGWKALIEWQKAFVDKIGYAKLQAFTSGLGQEFNANNAFQTGQIGMEVDGEWRTAFIADQAPKLNYGVAPLPVMPQYGTYGASYMVGNVAGIAKGSKNPELAWALLKFLALDTDAQVDLGNGLKNIPTLTSALTSPKLEVDPAYKVFIDAAQNPKTLTATPTADGDQYITIFGNMWTAYQSKGGDLDSLLSKVDSDITNASALSGP
jgi:multiple sugar transport system substrate-binding protein